MALPIRGGIISKHIICNNTLVNSKGTTPVNYYPQGESFYKVYDLVGNVWEWTTDSIKARGIGRKDKKVLKGGSFKANEGSLPCYEYSSLPPELSRDDIGFRCVWSK